MSSRFWQMLHRIMPRRNPTSTATAPVAYEDLLNEGLQIIHQHSWFGTSLDRNLVDVTNSLHRKMSFFADEPPTFGSTIEIYYLYAEHEYMPYKQARDRIARFRDMYARFKRGINANTATVEQQEQLVQLADINAKLDKIEETVELAHQLADQKQAFVKDPHRFDPSSEAQKVIIESSKFIKDNESNQDLSLEEIAVKFNQVHYNYEKLFWMREWLRDRIYDAYRIPREELREQALKLIDMYMQRAFVKFHEEMHHNLPHDFEKKLYILKMGDVITADDAKDLIAWRNIVDEERIKYFQLKSTFSRYAYDYPSKEANQMLDELNKYTKMIEDIFKQDNAREFAELRTIDCLQRDTEHRHNDRNIKRRIYNELLAIEQEEPINLNQKVAVLYLNVDNRHETEKRIVVISADEFAQLKQKNNNTVNGLKYRGLEVLAAEFGNDFHEIKNRFMYSDDATHGKAKKYIM